MRFVVKLVGHRDVRRGIFSIVHWVMMSVSPIGGSVTAASGEMDLTSVVMIKGWEDGNAACPERGPWRVSIMWAYSVVVSLACRPRVALVRES